MCLRVGGSIVPSHLFAAAAQSIRHWVACVLQDWGGEVAWLLQVKASHANIKQLCAHKRLVASNKFHSNMHIPHARARPLAQLDECMCVRVACTVGRRDERQSRNAQITIYIFAAVHVSGCREHHTHAFADGAGYPVRLLHYRHSCSPAPHRTTGPARAHTHTCPFYSLRTHFQIVFHTLPGRIVSRCTRDGADYPARPSSRVHEPAAPLCTL